MNTYEILRGSHGVWRDGVLKSFGPGDTADLTEREADNMVDLEGSQVRLIGSPQANVQEPEPVEPTVTEPEPEPQAEEVVTEPETEPDEQPTRDWSSVLTGNLDAAREAIANLSDPEEVHDLAQQEADGKNRKGVLKAARERLEELEGGGGDG